MSIPEPAQSTSLGVATAGPEAEPAPALARRAHDFQPWALVAAVAVLGALLTGSLSTWLTLTVAGLAMGMILFIMASGLTLVFGLMDVLNFGHGVLIATGAFVATSVFAGLGAWGDVDDLGRNLALIGAAMTAAMAVAGLVGWAFERVLIRPVYGQHLKQILITMGGMIIGEELIKAFWGGQMHPLSLPAALRGSFVVLDAPVERYRLFAAVLGLIVMAVLLWTLNRTKVGLLVRAGVQDLDMVESLGYRVRRLFTGVFVVGSALAGLGGVLWGLYQQGVDPQIGARLNSLLFIVIIIGGLGSTLGCLTGAILVGLVANYVGFVMPSLAGFSNILLLLGVLLWRPRGLFPLAGA